MVSSPIGSPRFIGREEELCFLRELLEDVRGKGVAQTVLIEGGAGAGKTRLLRQLQSEAGNVTWLTLTPLEYAPDPYAPFYLCFAGLDQGDRTIVTAAASLAPDVDLPKARRFADVRAVLRAQARVRPVVMAFEDVHWADDASLDLLRFLIDDLAEHSLLFALTARSGESGTRIGAMTHKVHRMLLRPLSDSEILEILREALRGRAELEVGRLRRISVLAEGNPLLAEELLRYALTGGGDIAPSVESAVLSRFENLEPAQRRILRVAALMESADETAIATILEADQSDVREALTGAAAVDLVQFSNGKWTFVHALTREAIAASASSDERVELHRRIAEFLERTLPDSFAVGRHWWEAGDAQRAAAANERAGDVAFAAHAYADAVTFFKRALDAQTGDARQLREKTGVALLKSGDAPAAKPYLIEARADAENAKDLEQVCSCDLSLSFVRWTEGAIDQAITIARDALVRLNGHPPSALHFRLWVRVAMASRIKGDDGGADAALERAGEFFNLGDTDTRIAFWNTRAMGCAFRWDVDGCVDAYGHALELAEESHNVELFASTLNNYGLNAVLLGRPDLAMPVLRRGLNVAYENGLRWHAGNTACTLARAHYFFGSLPDARAALLDAMAARYDAPTRAMTFAGYGIPIALALQDAELLKLCADEEALEQALQSGLAQFIGPVADGFVRLFAKQERIAEIESTLVRALESLKAGERPLYVLPHVARYCASPAVMHARKLLEAPNEDRIRAAERALFDAYTARRAGERAAAKRDAARAASLYREHHWILPAAEALLQAGRTVDARELLRAAGGVFGKPASAAEGAFHSLTPREREVAQLAVEGLSSREIAQRLHISERTAGNHLQSVFNRLGIGSRRELVKLSNSEPLTK